MENYNLDILKTEYNQACNQRKYLDDQANKYVSYIVAFLSAIGALLGLLMKDGEVKDLSAMSLVVVAGALILGMLVIMMLHHTMQCYRVGGYIKYLEEEINKQVSFDIMKWETVVATKHIHRDSASVLVYSIMGVIFCVFLAIAGILSVKYILSADLLVFGATVVIGVLEAVTACVYLVKIRTAHKTIYEIVRRKDNVAE